jgi:hypothetical protein
VDEDEFVKELCLTEEYSKQDNIPKMCCRSLGKKSKKLVSALVEVTAFQHPLSAKTDL